MTNWEIFYFTIGAFLGAGLAYIIGAVKCRRYSKAVEQIQDKTGDEIAGLLATRQMYKNACEEAYDAARNGEYRTVRAILVESLRKGQMK